MAACTYRSDPQKNRVEEYIKFTNASLCYSSWESQKQKFQFCSSFFLPTLTWKLGGVCKHYTYQTTALLQDNHHSGLGWCTSYGLKTVSKDTSSFRSDTSGASVYIFQAWHVWSGHTRTTERMCYIYRLGMDGDSTTNQRQCNHGRRPEANVGQQYK